MARNGRPSSRRTGTANTGGGNRTDLLLRQPGPPTTRAQPVTPSSGGRGPTQPVRSPQGLPYGEASALRAAQTATGLPDAQAQQQSSLAQAIQTASQSPLGSGGGLSRPTENPNEHVMTGAPSGPGAGPEILPASTSSATDPVTYLEGLYLRFPYPAIRSLIMEARKPRANPIPPPMVAPGVGQSLLPQRPAVPTTALPQPLTPMNQPPPTTPLIVPTGAEGTPTPPAQNANPAAASASGPPSAPAMPSTPPTPGHAPQAPPSPLHSAVSAHPSQKKK